MTTDRRRIARKLGVLGLLIGLCAGVVACSGPEKPTQARAVQPVVRDIPQILRNTIGTETSIRGLDPIIVSGLGLVVGLNGTGGGDLDERVAASMERELGLKGVSSTGTLFANTPLHGLTPREVLRHPSVAVAIVYAYIPPAAPEGMPFDVYVQALNSGGMTSLEGGRLWSTDLHLGIPAVYGGPKTRTVGIARGPIFVNPFAEPGAEGEGVTRRIGRILSGGSVTHARQLDLILDSPSYSRARQMVSTINSRFPQRAGDEHPTAVGRTDALININIPERYSNDPETFVNLLRYTQIDLAYPQEYAKRYAEALKAQPWLAEELSWCLQALGQPAIPFLRNLYDDPEIVPRMAALRAGAGLGDARAAESLKEIATSGPAGMRTQAIELLAELDAGPTVDLALRDLLHASELDVRVAAYEGLAGRAEKVQLTRLAAFAARQPVSARIGSNLADLEARAMMQFPGGTIQGVERRPAEDKFFLDLVPAGEPLIYVTQQGRPRIALFGERIELMRPLTLSIWSGRLLLASDSPTDDVRIFYQDLRGSRPVQAKVGPSLIELIGFMARTPKPEDPRPGMGLTYSEIVGALYEMQKAGVLNASFATEEDRLLARLMKASQDAGNLERPETSKDEPKLTVLPPPTPAAPKPPADAKPKDEGPLVVPLPQRPPGEKANKKND